MSKNNEPKSARINREVATKEARKLSAAELEKKLQDARERDAELVSGIFKNLERPGESIRFVYKAHKGDDVAEYELQDGERYRIPRGVAKHLNNNCFYREYKMLPGEGGRDGVRSAYHDGSVPTDTNLQAARKVHRFAFNSLEFMDDDPDFYPADIIEVTSKP